MLETSRSDLQVEVARGKKDFQQWYIKYKGNLERVKSLYSNNKRVIEKHLIQSARVLINGAAIAASAREGTHSSDTVARDIVQERDEGISRDRWDVAIATEHDTTVVPCGAIREQISQEIARRIFGAIRRTIETSN